MIASSPSRATVAPCSAGDRPLDVRGERDERMEGPDVAAGGQRRRQHLGPEQAAGVDERLAAVEAHRLRRRPAIASSGTARMASSTSSRMAAGSAKARAPGTRLAEPLPPAGVAAGDGRDRPAGPADGDAEGGADRARRPTIPTVGAPSVACLCGCGSEWEWISSPWRCRPGPPGANA